MKIIAARIAILEAIINAFAKVNAGVDKAQAAVSGAIDKAQAKATGALNARLDKLAKEYEAQANKARNAPFEAVAALTKANKELCDKFREDSDALRATFLEDCKLLNDRVAEASSDDALKQAAAEADAILQARANLLARKK